jgi:hypothetical protein
VVLNQDNDLVLTLDQLMVVKIVLVTTLRKENVDHKDVQLMEDGVRKKKSIHAAKSVEVVHNGTYVNVTTPVLLMVVKNVMAHHGWTDHVILTHAQLTDNGLTLNHGVNVQHRVVVEWCQDVDRVLTLDLLLVVKIVKVMTLRKKNVAHKDVQLTEDGVIMVHGVNVPNRVAVACSQDVDLVLNLVLLMVVKIVKAMMLKRKCVILTLDAQLMDHGENGNHSWNARNLVEVDPNSEVVNVTILLLLLVDKRVLDYHSILNIVIPKHAQWQLQQHHLLMDSGVNLVIGADVQNVVVVDHNQEWDSVTALHLPMVEMTVTVKEWRIEPVVKTLVLSMEDGVIMMIGVHVQ